MWKSALDAVFLSQKKEQRGFTRLLSATIVPPGATSCVLSVKRVLKGELEMAEEQEKKIESSEELPTCAECGAAMTRSKDDECYACTNCGAQSGVS